MTSIVAAAGLTKRYGEFAAIEDIDFEVQPGEVFGILGPNGAGKTTTVKILCTLLQPTSGSASVCGFDVVANPFQARARLGYVSQERMSDIDITGEENLMLVANLYHLKSSEIAARVDEMLKMMDLEPARHKLVRHYSGGMKKKLDIAGGLIHFPELLFLDEPSLGLDVPTRHTVWDYVRELKRRGITILLCTNYMDEADQLCDRVAILNAGRVRAIGSVERLKHEVGGEVVRLLMVDGTHGLGLQAALAGLPFVSKVIPSATSLNVFVQYDDQVIPKLLRVAAEKGIEVRGFQFSRPTLDDVFLKYTGQRIDEVGPPARDEARS